MKPCYLFSLSVFFIVYGDVQARGGQDLTLNLGYARKKSLESFVYFFVRVYTFLPTSRSTNGRRIPRSCYMFSEKINVIG